MRRKIALIDGLIGLHHFTSLHFASRTERYANLIGGALFEPEEENPMLGFRGASRYISDSFR